MEFVQIRKRHFPVLEKKQAMKKVLWNGSVCQSKVCSNKGLYMRYVQSLI